MSKIKVTMRDKTKIIGYLASPAGEAVFGEIEGKEDEYRIVLRIPEHGGNYVVTMSAGSLRNIVAGFLAASEQILAAGK
jgi:hypothetical protein